MILGPRAGVAGVGRSAHLTCRGAVQIAPAVAAQHAPLDHLRGVAGALVLRQVNARHLSLLSHSHVKQSLTLALEDLHSESLFLRRRESKA